MDIAALSIALSGAKVQQTVQISMLKKSMDQQEAQVQTLVQDMMQAAPSSHTLDIRA